MPNEDESYFTMHLKQLQQQDCSVQIHSKNRVKCARITKLWVPNKQKREWEGRVSAAQTRLKSFGEETIKMILGGAFENITRTRRVRWTPRRSQGKNNRRLKISQTAQRLLQRARRHKVTANSPNCRMSLKAKDKPDESCQPNITLEPGHTPAAITVSEQKTKTTKDIHSLVPDVENRKRELELVLNSSHFHFPASRGRQYADTQYRQPIAYAPS
jgi:hypothetical protein